MEVQEQESLGRWDGLGSRDAISRVEAMENIRQLVMTKVEAIKPIPSGAPSPPASGSPLSSDLNDILAHLLMLSRRCPFEDVRGSSSRLLQSLQVGVKTLPQCFMVCIMSNCKGLSYISHAHGLWYCSAAICSSLLLLIGIANMTRSTVTIFWSLFYLHFKECEKYCSIFMQRRKRVLHRFKKNANNKLYFLMYTYAMLEVERQTSTKWFLHIQSRDLLWALSILLKNGGTELNASILLPLNSSFSCHPVSIMTVKNFFPFIISTPKNQ